MPPSSVTDLEKLQVDTLRLLAVDMVEAAKSGHPGLPLGAAHVAHVLFTRHLRHAPTHPQWWDRDRFVLSAGHGCALLYSMLHLLGYDLPMEELRRFRQWGSRTPGHPEAKHTVGVEATTGPLGQGFGNGVGMALAARYLGERFNRPGHEIVSHRVYAIVSDGDLMEGVASEAASLAGTWGLGGIVYVYDDNGISIEGDTDLAFREDVGRRFEAYGWHVQHVDGHDMGAVDAAVVAAKAETRRPSLLVARTHIGLDSAVQDTGEAHGSPLGPDHAKALKRKLGWPEDQPFHVPEQALAAYRRGIGRGQEFVAEWDRRWAAYRATFPDLANELERMQSGRLPEGILEGLPSWKPGEKLATREASGKVIMSLSPRMPELVGGSADLAPSNNTYVKGAGDLGLDPGGRNVRFGVREHGMGSTVNGMALHGGVRPYGATFLVFTDYMRPAIRLAALTRLPVVYVMTHDSIGLGEDGPTHQPVEHLAALRAMPGLTVIRPADANETREAWEVALASSGPTLLALTRQKLPVLERPSGAHVRQGAYVLREARGGTPEAVVIATGSEVEIALAGAAQVEAAGGPATRVVSMPSWELFDAQPASWREAVLPRGVTARVSIEAATTFGWRAVVGDHGRSIGVDRFGASAPYQDVYRELGLTPEAVARAVREVSGA
jgi:transketolase